MIAKAAMFKPMLAALPSFISAWDDLVKEEAAFSADLGEVDRPVPIYRGLECLSAHLAKSLDGKQSRDLDRAFDIIEQWIVDGDPYVKEAATIGLFERIKHAKGPKSSFKMQFRDCLRPASRKTWDAL
jgi:hypothetical protein